MPQRRYFVPIARNYPPLFDLQVSSRYFGMMEAFQVDLRRRKRGGERGKEGEEKEGEKEKGREYP